jgi:hypothetical protein
MRNNIFFGEGKCGIKSSAEFLDNYLRTLTDIRRGREGHEEVDVKGKRSVNELKIIQAKKQYIVKPAKWKQPPDIGWHCLNVDASYVRNT